MAKKQISVLMGEDILSLFISADEAQAEFAEGKKELDEMLDKEIFMTFPICNTS